MSGVKAPTACLLLYEGETQAAAYFGHLSSCKAITTLESRIRVRRAQVVQPATKGELLDLILSPKLSASLIKALAAIPGNTKALQSVAATLAAPRHFNGPAALQQDAVETALAAFRLSIHHQASHLETTRPSVDRRHVLESV